MNLPTSIAVAFPFWRQCPFNNDSCMHIKGHWKINLFCLLLGNLISNKQVSGSIHNSDGLETSATTADPGAKNIIHFLSRFFNILNNSLLQNQRPLFVCFYINNQSSLIYFLSPGECSLGNLEGTREVRRETFPSHPSL